MSCSATEDKRRSQSCPFTRQQAAACASYDSPRGGDGPGVLGVAVVGPSTAPASASSVPLTGVSEQRAAPTHRLQPLMLHPNANTRELLCPARDNAINNALCTSVYVSAFRPADSIIPGVNKTPDMNQWWPVGHTRQIFPPVPWSTQEMIVFKTQVHHAGRFVGSS